MTTKPPDLKPIKYSIVADPATLMCEQDADPFVELAKPEHAGHVFAIARIAFVEEYRNDIEKVPKPDCEHAIFLDLFSDTYIVARPANGSYWCETGSNVERKSGKWYKVGPQFMRVR